MIRRILLASTVCIAAAGCTTAQVSSFETDASAALSDIKAAEPIIAAVPGVPAFFVADVTLADNGLQGILTAVQGSTTVEAATIAGAQQAVADLKAQLPANATVQTDAGLAETALSALSATSGQSAETQAFTALAALALEVETAEQSSSARMGSVAPAQALINDAHQHLVNIGGH